MFIELHMIQNFAPANLNRDDTGSPKDCEFGGARRARISSQCLKRAMRQTPIFKATTGVESSYRTKLLVQKISKEMFGIKTEDEDAGLQAKRDLATGLLKKFAETLYSGFKDEQANVLLFISESERATIRETVQKIMAGNADPKEQMSEAEKAAKVLAKQFKERTSAPDIALFGRMLAEHPDLNIDAACQVAHAISTHRVSMEMDFYTAVDELKKELQPEGKEDKGGAGAGMMGFSGYNSACFYRYARLDWNQLLKNLGGDVELSTKTARGFLLAAYDAIPTGKQNSSAAHNPPSLLLAVVRNGGMGWSLANAFETPTRAGHDSGYVAASVKKLEEYWKRLVTVYGDETVAGAAAIALDPGLELTTLASCNKQSLKELTTAILAALSVQEAA